VVTEGRHWVLKVHTNQDVLGRTILFAKRSNALDLCDMTEDEMYEMMMLLRTLRVVLLAAPFMADWMNYSFLGNAYRHLHAHVLPRYSSKRVFGGITFDDLQWGRQYHSPKMANTPFAVLDSVEKENVFLAIATSLRSGLATAGWMGDSR
jgi:diadenosine tetraphosphate (Ap4A) HIT family hydrolase